MVAAPAHPRQTQGACTRLQDLQAAQAQALAPELAQLHRLHTAGLPVAAVALWPDLSADAATPTLIATLQAQVDQHGRISLRVVPPRPKLAGPLRLELGLWPDIEAPTEVTDSVQALTAALMRAERRAGVDVGSLRYVLLIAPSAEYSAGGAHSVDPYSGHPESLKVWSHVAAAEPWTVERRSARVLEAGGGGLDAAQVSHAADLADRAQLVLGEPVTVQWVERDGVLQLSRCQALDVEVRFTRAHFKRLTLVEADEGVVAPLAVDCLGRALGPDATSVMHPRVQRLYARPYRRIAQVRSQVGAAVGYLPLQQTVAEAVRAAATLTLPLRDTPASAATLPPMDRAQDDDEALLEHVQARVQAVVHWLRIVERTRGASSVVMAAVTAAVGRLDRRDVRALAAPQPTRTRRKQLALLAQLAAADKSSSAVGSRAWHEALVALTEVRPLGIDVRPAAYGSSNAALQAALQQRPWAVAKIRDKARQEARGRVLRAARSRPWGRSRMAVVTYLLWLLQRVAQVKGQAAEHLASAWLNLRQAALSVGQVLQSRGSLESDEDALYLTVDELQDALQGEPGAYSARVRWRREEDARWAHFRAPRRILGANFDGAAPTGQPAKPQLAAVSVPPAWRAGHAHPS